jgi:hypothetical protein
MNCYLHPDATAIAYCRACGRPLCELCRRPVEGTIFCEEHVPAPTAGYASPSSAPSSPGYNPYSQGIPPGSNAPIQTSPGLAFILGCIPLGVGAIYNGQYLKGLIHALIFGLLVSVQGGARGTGETLAGILLAAFIFYMPFEAYHTAKRRQLGLPVDEWSSILPRKAYTNQASVGPIILILIGVAFLLDSLHIIDFWAIQRIWPVLWPILLIVVGAYALYSRLTDKPHGMPPAGSADGPVVEVRHE